MPWLTVYSGPYNTKIEGKVGCLYTGDFDARKNVNSLLQAYHSVWKHIGVIQIPHSWLVA